MQNTPTAAHPKNTRAMADEADIGSGEKTPGQLETEEMSRHIPPLSPAGSGKGEAATTPEQDRVASGAPQHEQRPPPQEDPGMTPDAAI